MAEQFKSMTPEDIREQKMRDKMGAAADKARENSLGTGKEPSTMEMLGNLGKKIKDSVMGTDKPAPAPEKKKAGGMCGGKVMKKMSAGGSASSRADGCAVKGKTKGKIC